MGGSLFKSTMNTRALDLKGWKLLVRSDCPEHITDAEIQWLKDNNVTTIIDLRRKSEVERHPCPLAFNENFDFHHIELSCKDGTPLTERELEMEYLGMVDEKLVEVINTIFAAKGNVLYYCFVGKDRTGIVTGIVLERMGIDRMDIIIDYMQSWANLEDFLIQYCKEHPESKIELLRPKKNYLLEAMDKFNHMFGDCDLKVR